MKYERQTPTASILERRASFAWIFLLGVFAVLWIAGGASRADALGQVIVRATCWLAVIALILLGRRPIQLPKPVLVLMIAALATPLVQLIPLPPDVWQSLPGREMFSEAALASGQPQPWRPLSIVPDATLNAASSLIVPFTVLLLVGGLRENERDRLPGALLILALASSLLGLLQISGAAFDNPLINETRAEASGPFANRNHFAVFIAIGGLLVPIWAFRGVRTPGWQGAAAVGMLLLFIVTLLASGSRAGLVVGVLGVSLGVLIARAEIKRGLSRFPRWVSWALMGSVCAAAFAAVLVSFTAGRAISINRVFAIGQDSRLLALPTLSRMVREYSPVGSGVGSFDPVFRIHEPFELLKPTYLNHAHNDWIEIVLDAGLVGLVLLLAGVVWWVVATIRVWRGRPDRVRSLGRLGSAVLLLIMVASAFDYPLRTPLMMAVAVIAAIWLGMGARTSASSALPASKQHL